MSQTCRPGTKKSSKLVRDCSGKMRCVRYGQKGVSIKKHIPRNKKSFCARHRCSTKSDVGTPGYWSCKAWDCKTARRCSKSRATSKSKPKKTNNAKPPKSKSTKSSKSLIKVKTSRAKRSRVRASQSKPKVYVSASGKRYSRCWKGYKRSGWKMKNGRRVPNCVKA